MFERIRLFLLRLVPGHVLRLIEGFWAIPLLMSLAGIGLSAGIQLVPESAVGPGWRRSFGSIDVEGAQSALSVIAGGMVSLIALVFSLTFVALSITAQQLSPRILDFVLRERSAQSLLGLALATLIYAAITLYLGDANGAWRVGLAMPPSLLLALATLVMVVVFAHGMTRVMRADEMVARIGNHFVADMHALLRPPAGSRAAGGDTDAFETLFEAAAQVTATRAGYVGTIDYKHLIAFAAKRDLRILLQVRESAFLLPGVPLARIIGLHDGTRPPGTVIQAALNLTDRREPTDVAGYEAAALCEAALRALSPGINDPATAISCVNRLFEGLAVLVSADPPPRLLAGADGVARLLRPPREVPEFLANAVVPIVAAARRDARTLDRIDTLAGQLDALSDDPRARSSIADLRRRVEEVRAAQRA